MADGCRLQVGSIKTVTIPINRGWIGYGVPSQIISGYHAGSLKPFLSVSKVWQKSFNSEPSLESLHLFAASRPINRNTLQG